ncbi:hypothetical protein BC835DRAFT_614462 [Cytidiella melzeri]|nr:hypothetical protein BC835DRAFT_614462 [Cytidiella melzeri]
MVSSMAKLTLGFLLLCGLAGLGKAEGYAHGATGASRVNACANDCTWMAAQVAGCSGMDIHCACTSPSFQVAFRECVETSCSFAEAGEGVQFYTGTCAILRHHDGLYEGSGYNNGPKIVENIHHDHHYHGHHDTLYQYQRRGDSPSSAASNPTTLSEAPASSSVKVSVTSTANSESVVVSSSISSSAHASSSTAVVSHASTSSSATAISHSSSQTHTTGTTSTQPTVTTPTPPTTNTIPTSSDAAAIPTTTAIASSVAELPSSGGTTLVVGASSGITTASQSNTLNVNPSITTPAISTHFDSAPTSSGAQGAIKAGLRFMVLVGVVGAALVL